jgi:hypothetical protein
MENTEQEIVDSVINNEETTLDVVDEIEDDAVLVEEDKELDTAEDSQDQTNKDEDDGDYEPFPKKAKNAISRRDKQIAKLRYELAEIKAKSDQAQDTAQKVDDTPNEDDFDTYGEYLEAKTLHKLRQEMALQNDSQKEQQLSAEQQHYVQVKSQEIATKAQEYSKTVSDFQEVMDQNAEILDFLPPHVEQAFYEADDAALAFYNLAKSGRLDELLQANTYKAAMMIGQAQGNPAVIAKPKATQAPRPIRGVSGTGQTSPTLDQLSNDPDKLMKWLNS